jgi:hypothetical protein
VIGVRCESTIHVAGHLLTEKRSPSTGTGIVAIVSRSLV